jgi:4-hydroxy-3-methylbut-2-enyl diphosphate reductase
VSQTYFQKGFGLKGEVRLALEESYHSPVVAQLKALGYEATVGDVRLKLAREFGFCYGVERAVEYAYQTRTKFPDRRILLVGEIIHNPHVNARLREMGIEILIPSATGFDYAAITPQDVVILPAFGVPMKDFQTLRASGCVIVDTTCGSVLNVWKRVDAYARDGLTSLIHGKHYHEETRATASQAETHPGAHWIVVRDMAEAKIVCEYVEGRGDREAFLTNFAPAVSPGFDPDLHLRRIGVANQTTMLASESLAIGEEVGSAIARARGADARAVDFRSFDTICSATQDRQDAVKELLAEPLDVMVVVGGYNSSNTISLAAICAEHVTTYHVEDAEAIDPESGTIRHKPIGRAEEVSQSWMPAHGAVRIGLTAGASTPNNKIGDTVARVFATRGIDPATIE